MEDHPHNLEDFSETWFPHRPTPAPELNCIFIFRCVCTSNQSYILAMNYGRLELEIKQIPYPKSSLIRVFKDALKFLH